MDGTIPHNLPEVLRNCLRSHRDRRHTGSETRTAAVLLPLYQHSGVWHLLFTKRTDTVEEHKGQVAFPGGGEDHQDHGPVETALRETEEEIGVHPSDVTVLGALDAIITFTNWRVTPIVGTLPYPYRFRVNLSETAAVFGVSLNWLAKPSNLKIQHLNVPGSGRKRAVYFFRPFRGYVVWGVTARMVLSLLEVAGIKTR